MISHLKWIISKMEKFFKLIEKVKVLNIKKQLKKMLVLLLFSVKFYRNDINNTKEVVLSFLQLTIYLNIIFSVSWWLVSNGRYFLIVMGFLYIHISLSFLLRLKKVGYFSFTLYYLCWGPFRKRPFVFLYLRSYFMLTFSLTILEIE